MRKERFDESKAMHKNARDLQETLINKSDMNHKTISNERAKYVMGSIKRVPEHLQTSTLNDLEKLGLIKLCKGYIEILKD
jgi:hypothetical protein